MKDLKVQLRPQASIFSSSGKYDKYTGTVGALATKAYVQSTALPFANYENGSSERRREEIETGWFIAGFG